MKKPIKRKSVARVTIQKSLTDKYVVVLSIDHQGFRVGERVFNRKGECKWLAGQLRIALRRYKKGYHTFPK